VYESIHFNETGNQFALGSFSMNGTATGNPAVGGSTGDPLPTSFLDTYQRTRPVSASCAQLVGSYYAGFANDTFHVTRNLTFTYGLRYEYLMPFKDLNDASSNITDINTNSPIVVRASNQGQISIPTGLAIRLQNVTLVRDGSMGPRL